MISENSKNCAPVTLARVWCFLTGWQEDKLGKIEDSEQKAEWSKCLNWPPHVFALSAAVLRRSGAYSSALTSIPGRRPLSKVDKRTKELEGVDEWRNSLANSKTPLETSKIGEIWKQIWDSRTKSLEDVSGEPDLLVALVDAISLADEMCRGFGLPIREDLKGLTSPSLIRDGWKRLEPDRFGSTLCGDLIDPHAARVLPKMHTPASGLTMRSFSHHLALCETDEVQPRWFMIPGARGNVENQNHINLLVIPWPEECLPAQVGNSVREGRPIRKDGDPVHYFRYDLKDLGHVIADRVDALCEEAKRLLGSLDVVVLPELALTQDDYHAVRMRVLRKGLMLVTGVGRGASEREAGENYLCVDVPLSKHHAIQFRQGKHHRWRLDASQIRMYGIGARLHPENAYWEDIGVADRRLLFLVLRPWLVTSVLICEDLARHDPVGELLRSVGPHLVIALLMDGPQLASRWSSRYATALADDPGSSVLSISSLGMVGLSRWDTKTTPSRVVALWKDARSGFARELEIPPGASGLALTISVDYGKEVSADGRVDDETSAYPTLTGFHAVNLPAGWHDRGFGDLADPNEMANDAARRYLSPHEAAALARLVQQDPEEDPAPSVLRELTGEALAIAKEIWRIKIDDPTDGKMKEWCQTPYLYADLPTPQQTDTARQIYAWQRTNSRNISSVTRKRENNR